MKPETKKRIKSVAIGVGWVSLGSAIMIGIVFAILLVPGIIGTWLDDMYIDVEYIGLVTDKWIRNEPAFWIIGNSENYYLEINDNHIVNVDAFEYYNTDIGSYRNWTTRELKT